MFELIFIFFVNLFIRLFWSSFLLIIKFQLFDFGKVSQAFNKAVSNPENIQANGHVNWNYVDADVYMDVGPRDTDGNPANNQKHYAMFDVLASAFEKANGKQVQSDIR